MKFIFERDMKKKSDCFRCPCVRFNSDFTSFFCELLGKNHPDDSECPLEEAKTTDWHPYPAEKPPVGTYIICCHDGAGDADMAFADYKADRFIGWEDTVFAWAIPPKPYEEK